MKAFPSIDWDSQIESKNNQLTPISSDMDLRDYFAAKAMQALLFDIKAIQVDMNKTANLAYKFADAMMEARNE